MTRIKYLIYSLVIAAASIGPAAWSTPRQVRAAVVRPEAIVTGRGIGADEAAVRELMARLRALNVNTVYVEATRGGAELWPGGRLPQMKDAAGGDLLAAIVDECRFRAIDCQVLLQMTEVGSEADAARYYGSTPAHPIHDARGLTVAAGQRRLMDAGNPAAREEMATIVRDLVARYDVDGVLLDGLIYPLDDVDDLASYRLYNADYLPADEWRRANLDELARGLAEAAREARPGVKVGLATWSTYTNAPGYSYAAAYDRGMQDAAKWMREGVIDYVVPMMTIEKADGFERSLGRWVDNASGRRVVAGVMTSMMTDGVNDWAARTVNDQFVTATGRQGVSGVALFDSRTLTSTVNAKNGEVVDWLAGDLFAHDAHVPVMEYAGSGVVGGQPEGVVQSADGATVRIEWSEPAGDRPRYYNVYELDAKGRVDTDDASRLVASRVNDTELTVTGRQGGAVYAVTAFDRDYRESEPTVAVVNTGVEGVEMMNEFSVRRSGGNIEVMTTVDDIATVDVYSVGGVLVDHQRVNSTEATVDTRRYSRGVYVVRVVDARGVARVFKFIE